MTSTPGTGGRGSGRTPADLIFARSAQRSPLAEADGEVLARIGPDLHAGLAVQLEVLDRWLAAGEALGGWKAGLSSRGARDSMGPGFRPFGYLLHGRMLPSGATVSLAELFTCRLEPEIGILLGADLAGPDVTAAQVRDSTAGLVPAIEVLDSRLAALPRSAAVRLADDLGQWGVVLGDPVEPPADASAISVRFSGPGAAPVTAVAGPEVIDDPYLSVARMCRELARHGRGLRADQIVITGSVLEPATVTAPGAFRADFSGLGAVEVLVRSGR
jgi:2-keto-4-pentenoate hydratase